MWDVETLRLNHFEFWKMTSTPDANNRKGCQLNLRSRARLVLSVSPLFFTILYRFRRVTWSGIYLGRFVLRADICSKIKIAAIIQRDDHRRKGYKLRDNGVPLFPAYGGKSPGWRRRSPGQNRSYILGRNSKTAPGIGWLLDTSFHHALQLCHRLQRC